MRTSISIKENWNRDHPERNSNFYISSIYSNFYRSYAKGKGCGRSTHHPHGWYNTICSTESLKIISNTSKLSNCVLVRFPIYIYYYEEMITLFVILLAETPSAWFNSMYYAYHQLPMLYQHWVELGRSRSIRSLMYQLQICWSTDVSDAPDLLINKCWAREKLFNFVASYCVLNPRFVDQQSLCIGEAIYFDTPSLFSTNNNHRVTRWWLIGLYCVFHILSHN